MKTLHAFETWLGYSISRAFGFPLFLAMLLQLATYVIDPGSCFALARIFAHGFILLIVYSFLLTVSFSRKRTSLTVSAVFLTCVFGTLAYFAIAATHGWLLVAAATLLGSWLSFGKKKTK